MELVTECSPHVNYSIFSPMSYMNLFCSDIYDVFVKEKQKALGTPA